MRLDVKRTAEARAQQKRAIRQLRALFGLGPLGQLMLDRGRMRSFQVGMGRPVRLRPGVPPLRSPERKARHLKRKRARAARRRNRPR